ncbi:MerR family transcriptional regulator [Monashia sp. NPDC004114]
MLARDQPDPWMQDSTGRMPPRRLLTPQEAADIIQVSPTTLLRWAREGAVPCVTIPSGRRRFRISDLPGFDRADLLTP